MHHFLLAGLIVYAELAATLRALHEQPQVRERLRAEVLAGAPSGPIGPAQLRAMPYLMQVVDEVKRTCPNVPMSFGRAKRDDRSAGYTVPQGSLVMMAIHESNLDPIFTAPEQFDPGRFSAERDEKKRAPDAFIPQGAGAITFHKCAGYDFATVMMQLFAALTLRTAQLGPARAGPFAQMGGSPGAQERPRRPLVQERVKRSSGLALVERRSRSSAAARGTARRGRRCAGSSIAGCPRHASSIGGLEYVSPSNIQGGSRMP